MIDFQNAKNKDGNMEIPRYINNFDPEKVKQRYKEVLKCFEGLTLGEIKMLLKNIDDGLDEFFTLSLIPPFDEEHFLSSQKS